MLPILYLDFTIIEKFEGYINPSLLLLTGFLFTPIADPETALYFRNASLRFETAANLSPEN